MTENEIVTTTELTAEMTGKWLVETQGSTHIWDLDAGTWQRLPGKGRSTFSQDGEPVKVTRVERWPKVGGVSFVVWDDPRLPHAVEQWRQSSTIKSITRVTD